MFNGGAIQDIIQRMSDQRLGLLRLRRWFSADSDSEQSDDDKSPEEEVSDTTTTATAATTPSASFVAGDAILSRETVREDVLRSISVLYENMFTGEQTLCLERVESVLSVCCEVNVLSVEDKDHYNLLHKAVIVDSIDLIQLLLKHGQDVNFSGNHSTCNISAKCPHNNIGALHLASFLGRVEIVHTLLQHGCDCMLKKRVYTSAVIHCPGSLQPPELCSEQPDYIAEMLSRCGEREPVFYAVLGDHVAIVEMFLENTIDLGSHSNLLSLACRVGSRHCLEYLVKLFPNEINKYDSDGLPPLLMSMKHGLGLVLPLLRHNADVTTLDNLWENGSNVLHFLFKALPFKDMHKYDIEEVVDLCIASGAKVNSKRQPSDSTPMHDLLVAVNLACGVDFKNLGKKCISFEAITCYDDSIAKAVLCMLQNTADVNVLDCNGKSAVNLLLMNEGHLLRYTLFDNAEAHPDTRSAMMANSYGLDNILRLLRMMMEHGAKVTVNDYGMTPLCDFIDAMCSSDFSQFDSTRIHALELLSIPSLLQLYQQVITTLLCAGCDPNHCPPERLPPLLHLLSVTSDVEGYVIDVTSALGLVKLFRVLLEGGARTECEVGTRRRCSRMVGGFDLLMGVLETMQDYPRDRTVADLTFVRELAKPLLQYGARAVVYHKLLYGDPGNLAEVPWCYYMPNHSFLYQVLQFGALNLQFVNDGEEFFELASLLCNHADHYTLQDVVNALNTQFSAMHAPEICECGRCLRFASFLRSRLTDPRSLKQLCRFVILNNLDHTKRCTDVEKLSLPSAIQEYLISFQD